MIYVLVGIVFIVIVFGPNVWVRHVLKKHHRHLPGMPGTGAELALHLIEQYQLEGVELVKGEADQNFYRPSDNTVSLSPDVYDGKSLSAVAIAAHEVGHAIQFNRKEPVSFLRDRYLGKANFFQKCGVYILMALPLVAGVLHIPHAIGLYFVIGILTLLSSVLMYAAILPEEWDASFNKALPILEAGDFVPKVYLPAIRQILKACALTYVAAALADVLSLWRWLILLR
ncbi:MAG: Zn-dependent membrane protease YugP [Oceanicoccus sp.]|jgi:Zn-dependent membrane protease YugP